MKRIFAMLLALILVFGLMACGEYDDTRVKVIVQTENIIEGVLKSPTTAQFCKSNEYTVGINREAGLALVGGYVDSQNGFGAMIRTEFVLEFDISNPDSYKLVFAKLGEETYGELIVVDFEPLK